jgi:hypothetical protein
MEKICYGCKKMKPLNHYIENEKEYAKCNVCRIKLVNKKNICDVCGIRASYNIDGILYGIRCSSHKDLNMVDVKSKKCITCKKLYPNFNYAGKKSPEYCSSCKDPSMINITCNKCIICKKKQPNFNYIGEKNLLYCSDCKKEDMIDVHHDKCEKCKKVQPIYNYENEIQPKYCNKCKEPNMVDVKNKKCIKCKKTRPTYNYPTELRGIYCNSCKEPDMINVMNKKCITCNTQFPIFNYESEKKALYCSTCKEPSMVDVVNKKCITCKSKRPSYNKDGETSAKYCFDCKESDMVDVNHKRCVTCRKRAIYAYPGVSETHCATHKQSGMMINSRKRCIMNDCKEIATHGINKPLHCEIHATDSGYNLAEQTCSKCNRIDVLNKNGICINFCSFEEKDRLMKKSVKKHEEFIGKLLKEEIDLTCMYQDEVVDSTCSKKRPDFVYHCGTHIVIIEVDENQHKSYKCTVYGDTKEGKIKGENIRMYEIAQSFDGLPVVFIRYNPDELKDVDQHKVKISSSKRHLLLIKWIKTIFRMEWKQGIYVKYLFYDGFQESNIDFLSISEKDVLTF